MGDDEQVRAALRVWRDSLVDLGATNRLVDLRAAKGSLVELTDPAPAELVRTLHATGECAFRGSIPGQSAPGADRLTAAVLRRLQRTADREYLDRGMSVLYVAAGELRWRDEEDAECVSPALLVPVTLAPRRAGERAGELGRLRWRDDDPVVNPALAIRLRELGVRLPMEDPLADGDLAAFWSRLEATIAGRDGWRLEPIALLSCFTFQKEALYRDLLDNESRVVAHPVVRALATTGEPGAAFDFVPLTPATVDEQAPPEDVPLVLDADGSQRACVAAAVAGHSFVMDGPPGTGKSQTIANMIACLLAAGKQILFVSTKAAALDVVRRRLAEAGLEPYLLDLHSRQAGRKEVAAALAAAVDRAPAPPVGTHDRLRPVRERLTAYAAAVNEVREPLGATLHDALGICAEFTGLPDAPVPDLARATLTAEAMRRIEDAAERLANTWRAAAESRFPWRHVVERGPLDDVLTRAGLALGRLVAATRRNAQVAAAFDVDRPSRAGLLVDLLAHAARRPPEARDAWLTAPSLAPAEAALADLELRLAAVRRAREAVRTRAGVPWSALPTDTELPDVAVDPAALTADAADDLARRYADEGGRWEKHRVNLDLATARLGLPRVVVFADVRRLAALAELSGRPYRPEPFWFGPGVLATVSAGAVTLRRCLETLTAAEARARPMFTEAILGQPLDRIIPSVADHGRGLRRLGPAYRRDKRMVAAFVRPGADVREAMSRLDTALAWQRARWGLAAAEQSYAMVLGGYWRGPATDFPALDAAIQVAAEAVRWAPPEALPAVVRHVCAAETDLESIGLATAARADLDRWQPAHPRLADGSVEDAVAWLRAQVAPLRTAARAMRAFGAATGRDLDYAEVQRLAELRRTAVEAQDELNVDARRYECLFGADQVPPDADHRVLEAALGWAAAARRLITGADRPLADEQVRALAASRPDDALPDLVAGWERDRRALLAAFAPARHDELSADLDDYQRAGRLLDDLRDDATGPEEWFGHLAARDELAELGLGTAVEFCSERDVEARDVVPVLRRAVYQAWAERILLTDGRLRPQRGEDRDHLVAGFRHGDRRLVAAAPAEVLARLSARPPADAEQIRLIFREALKASGHLPVRELIARAGAAVHRLKPCLMMSPLSVSQYLPPDIRFDVVIFDEASQVTPADAMPAIYRAGALVVAGDERQLPPPCFFAAVPDPSAGVDGAATDVDDFASILELAKGCGAFRQLGLAWHYRSRHESLIAFANHRFYQGRMITFPSANAEGPDTGLELFGVPGVYRRGAGRHNPIEAQRVAERVVHHFATRPDQSLGVVTFSVAQADEIQRAVERAMGAELVLDPGAHDARLSGFFVKSLESVQGDERDVMIFSIGYGHDEDGRISANFGSLNRPYGWRRLNVAITRARRRIEIVSSVRARDIPESDSEGVQALVAYLAYAERGVPVPAPHDDRAPQPGPFEESVFATITSWGYTVRRNVGTSRWRVDLAVRHPAYPGEVYALAVQCDGPGYPASVAARDRDRLRGELLVDLGWRLHQVWSTAWHRDRAAEERRLRAAIEEAIASPAGGRPPPSPAERAIAVLTAALPEAPEVPEAPPETATPRAEAPPVG
ncbi:DUF4011 domain-containing protein [Paractinoplanes hotanensis]|uniref:DUF4011 domain-containing protein n=1 Tax=Paractinoplanes hotanensis TaxID=2906497 RepID=A0ABT0XWM2_9ACTN|nr:DUF4011 domain-containing protein [Actinoplanes hotanensis]MCM4078187.1 DUF4011 domain-containing protein [Actinoplanes hotanensis]